MHAAPTAPSPAPLEPDLAVAAPLPADLQWRLDACRTPAAAQRAAAVVRRNVVALGLLAAAVWSYDVVRVLTG